MKTTLVEKIKYILKSRELELVGNISDINENSKCIELWIPWEDCSEWSTYEEAFRESVEMDDKGNVRKEYTQDEINKLYKHMCFMDKDFLQQECRFLFEDLFNVDIRNKKFIEEFMDIVICASDYPAYNDSDIKIGLFNLFNQILNNFSVDIHLLDKLNDNSDISDMIADINFKKFSSLLEYGEDFEALVLSKLDENKSLTTEYVEAALKNSLVELQENYKTASSMRYIDALNLLNLCVEHDILHVQDGYIAVYRDSSPTSKEGWYLTSKEDLAQELMNDSTGQDMLVDALKNKNINFKHQ